MAQKKAHEVEAWVRAPDLRFPVILVYGPDRGMVSERAQTIAAATGLQLSDPFSVVRIDAAALESEPGRLLDEARTVPMFADRRLIWVRGAAAQKQLSDDLQPLLEDPPRDSIVLIEGGELRKGAALRSLVEASPRGMALPCYPDEGRDLDRLIDETFSRDGLSIAPEVRQLLRRSLGGDRMASRGELDKLALYCRGAGKVTIDDVVATIGDVAALSLDEVIDAMLLGRSDEMDLTLTRLIAAGTPPFQLLSAAMRQFQTLLGLGTEMERGGRNAASAVASARPPVFFSRRKTVETALRTWSPDKAARALERLQAAVLTTRRRPDLAVAATRHALIALTAEAGRGGRSAG